MQMPDGYQIPDDPDAGHMDAAYLRTCLGIPTPLSGEPPQLPMAVRKAYFHMAHALSRLGAKRPRMDATQIATVVALSAMLGDSVEEPPPTRTFLDDLEDGIVDEGGKVVVRYRAADHPGHFLRVEGDKIVVLHDGNERRCHPTAIRIPNDGEFPDVPSSINNLAGA